MLTDLFLDALLVLALVGYVLLLVSLAQTIRWKRQRARTLPARVEATVQHHVNEQVIGVLVDHVIAELARRRKRGGSVA